MYEVSEKYKEAIRSHSRKFKWYGTITTTAGRAYQFTEKDIVKGSGTLTRSCAGSTALELGSVYSAELDISLFLNVDRYSLYDAVIDLYFVYQHRAMYSWNDLRGRTWNSLRGIRWNQQYEDEAVPMGKFVISEATRTLTVLQMKAYDYMLKFDKSTSPRNTFTHKFTPVKTVRTNFFSDQHVNIPAHTLSVETHSHFIWFERK